MINRVVVEYTIKHLKNKRDILKLLNEEKRKRNKGGRWDFNYLLGSRNFTFKGLGPSLINSEIFLSGIPSVLLPEKRT